MPPPADAEMLPERGTQLALCGGEDDPSAGEKRPGCLSTLDPFHRPAGFFIHE
jgi:hypothetical protein